MGIYRKLFYSLSSGHAWWIELLLLLLLLLPFYVK